MIAKRSLDLIKEGIDSRLFSGAGFALISKKRPSGIGTIGRLAFDPEADRVNRDTLFDVASLTKPLATSMAVLQLSESNKFDSPYVSHYFPQSPHLKKITYAHLLKHESGLPPIPEGEGKNPVELALSSPLQADPGVNRVYSDTGYIILGELVKLVSGTSLDEYFIKHIAEPLYLKHSCFKPDLNLPIVATSDDESLDGLPHDPRAREMGGVAGHAGLFMSTEDIATYARALLGNGKALLSEEAFAGLFTESPARHSHTGVFITAGNPYMHDDIGFSDARVGHSGFTGCFILIDRKTETAACLLTNRVLNTTKEHSEFLQWRKRWLAASALDLGIVG